MIPSLELHGPNRLVSASVPASTAAPARPSGPTMHSGAGIAAVSLDGGRGMVIMPDRVGTFGTRARVFQPDPSLRLGSAEFERILDRETRSIARPGNRVKLLPDGKSAFAARDQLFADAQRGETIHQQTFVSNNDRTGWKNAEQMRNHTLLGAARHIFDPIGSWKAVRDDRRIFDFMRAGGVEVAEVDGKTHELLRNLNNRNHQKMLMLGMRRAIVGGANIGDMYANNGVAGTGFEGEQVKGEMPRLKIVGWEMPYKLVEWRGWFRRERVTTYKQPWHDVDFLIEGPVIADLQRTFFRNWEACGFKANPLTVADMTNPMLVPMHDDGISVRYIEHRPREDRDDHITAALVRHIDAAQDNVFIETPYFSPPPALRDALTRAARRGVPVTVLTNSREAVNHKMAYDTGHGMYREMIEAGVAIHEKASMVHAKLMTVDDRVTLGGSANFNGRSRYCDAETLLVMNDEGLTIETRTMIEEQLERTKRMTLDDLGGAVQAVRSFFWGLLRKNT